MGSDRPVDLPLYVVVPFVENVGCVKPICPMCQCVVDTVFGPYEIITIPV